MLEEYSPETMDNIEKFVDIGKTFDISEAVPAVFMALTKERPMTDALKVLFIVNALIVAALLDGEVTKEKLLKKLNSTDEYRNLYVTDNQIFEGILYTVQLMQIKTVTQNGQTTH